MKDGMLKSCEHGRNEAMLGLLQLAENVFQRSTQLR